MRHEDHIFVVCHIELDIRHNKPQASSISRRRERKENSDVKVINNETDLHSCEKIWRLGDSFMERPAQSMEKKSFRGENTKKRKIIKFSALMASDGG
jgi:hypothetical protein